MFKKRAPSGWASILEAARRLSPREGVLFTARELARSAGIEGTAKSPADAIASAWLGKFVRWGYCRRAGVAESGRRWCRTYTLTAYGFEVEPGTGSRGNRACRDLAEAVRGFGPHATAPAAKRAWQAMLRLAEEIR